MFWLGLVIGYLIGVFLGWFIIALCQAAADMTDNDDRGGFIIDDPQVAKMILKKEGWWPKRVIDKE